VAAEALEPTSVLVAGWGRRGTGTARRRARILHRPLVETSRHCATVLITVSIDLRRSVPLYVPVSRTDLGLAETADAHDYQLASQLELVSWGSWDQTRNHTPELRP
jgi:hypothetical protein